VGGGEIGESVVIIR